MKTNPGKRALTTAALAAAIMLTANAQVEEVLYEPSPALVEQSAADPITLYCRGGAGNGPVVASAELAVPIGDTHFDFLVREFYLRTEKTASYEKRTRQYYQGNFYYTTYDNWSEKEEQYNVGSEALCLWRPFRNSLFSPYVGAGVRYERIGNGSGEASAAGRIGLLVDLKRVFIVGEYLAGSDSSELIGDLSFYLTQSVKLHVFVERFELDLDNGMAYGGGVSFNF